MIEDARFESAWSEHGPAVLRYCVYSTGSKDVGEDLAAEAFARFIAKGEHVPPEHTEAWLIRVARNLCASHHRDEARGRLLVLRLTEKAPPRGEGWRDPSEWEYVRRLSETERLVIYLRVVDERLFSDVARLTCKSESATKMIFYRAVERLRRHMQRDGLGRAASLKEGTEHA